MDGPRDEEINAARARRGLGHCPGRTGHAHLRPALGICSSKESGAVTREELDRSTEEVKVTQGNSTRLRRRTEAAGKGVACRRDRRGGRPVERSRAGAPATSQVTGNRPEDIAQAQAAVAAFQKERSRSSTDAAQRIADSSPRWMASWKPSSCRPGRHGREPALPCNRLMDTAHALGPRLRAGKPAEHCARPRSSRHNRQFLERVVSAER